MSYVKVRLVNAAVFEGDKGVALRGVLGSDGFFFVGVMARRLRRVAPRRPSLVPRVSPAVAVAAWPPKGLRQEEAVRGEPQKQPTAVTRARGNTCCLLTNFKLIVFSS